MGLAEFGRGTSRPRAATRGSTKRQRLLDAMAKNWEEMLLRLMVDLDEIPHILLGASMPVDRLTDDIASK
jgi:hypothetical protein